MTTVPNRKAVFAVSVLLSFALPLAAQHEKSSPQIYTLSDSSRRVVFDASAFEPEQPPPTWSGGYLAFHDLENFQEGVSNVRLYDSSGGEVFHASVWFPDTQRLLLYSAVATSKGEAIVSGSDELNDGTHFSFIAKINRAGQIAEILRTSDYYASNVCEAPDGTIWTFGGTGHNQDSQPNPGDTLRHFDLRTGQLASFVPRSTFPKHPPLGPIDFIRCGQNEVAVYSVAAKKYVELKYDSSEPRIYNVATTEKLRMSGFALTGRKMVFANLDLLGKTGLYYLSFDENAGAAKWLPVLGTVGKYDAPGVIRRLWGSDDHNLVVSRSLADEPVGEDVLYWIAPVLTKTGVASASLRDGAATNR